MRPITHLLTSLLLAAFLTACGGETTESAPAEAPSDPSGLTADQLEKGVGPISSVSIGEIDAALASKGEEVFTVKCSACHKMSERYVGPALGGVTSRRSPEFVMNMILNPEEMIAKHPVIKDLLAQHMSAMPNQNVTEEEARAVLEYLRTMSTDPE